MFWAKLQLGFVIFCRKNIGAKAARRMLVKLTTEFLFCHEKKIIQILHIAHILLGGHASTLGRDSKFELYKFDLLF